MNRLRALPIVVLLGITSLPLIFLVARLPAGGIDFDLRALLQTMEFAAGGAVISTIIGTGLGILFGALEFPGRRSLLVLAIMPIAAPPAFWWIGAQRLMPGFANAARLPAAALAGGVALSPITLLFVFAALRQLPSNLYEAARGTLPPFTRVFAVLLPLVRSALVGGFVITLIVLLGESELPFLFGFRTLMTNVVTTFSQTFDVGRTVPSAIPLLVIVLLLARLTAGPLLQMLLTSARGIHGVVRRPAALWISLFAAIPGIYIGASLVGYISPVLAALRLGPLAVPIDGPLVASSIIEPVASAWIALGLTLLCAYGARNARALSSLVWASLLLFCVPTAVYAIGWIAVGQALGGVAIPPVVAHVSRAVALSALGFGVARSRMPSSFDNAAKLVQASAFRRATVFVLPVIAAPLIASSALAAVLTYSDRDVSSLLLAPGTSRLTLSLYLASANAPSSTIGVLALALICGAAATVSLAAAGPALVWRRRV